jgi:hypothetical protein
MTLAHFLAPLMVCSALAFAQQKPDSLASSTQIADASQSGTVASAEPWKFIPNQTVHAASAKDSLDRLQIDKYKLVPSKTDTRALLWGPEADAGMILTGVDGQTDGPTTCLKIRSYVVARDSKDSDSTHPVSYSTCQPSSRYHVKTTEIRIQSADR